MLKLITGSLGRFYFLTWRAGNILFYLFNIYRVDVHGKENSGLLEKVRIYFESLCYSSATIPIKKELTNVLEEKFSVLVQPLTIAVIARDVMMVLVWLLDWRPVGRNDFC